MEVDREDFLARRGVREMAETVVCPAEPPTALMQAGVEPLGQKEWSMVSTEVPGNLVR